MHPPLSLLCRDAAAACLLCRVCFTELQYKACQPAVHHASTAGVTCAVACARRRLTGSVSVWYAILHSTKRSSASGCRRLQESEMVSHRALFSSWLQVAAGVSPSSRVVLHQAGCVGLRAGQPRAPQLGKSLEHQWETAADAPYNGAHCSVDIWVQLECLLAIGPLDGNLICVAGHSQNFVGAGSRPDSSASAAPLPASLAVLLCPGCLPGPSRCPACRVGSVVVSPARSEAHAAVALGKQPPAA